ncbi:MAG: cofactor-independent phosphoglycerate mutase [Dehalococcoidia bacterium]|nr:cofactor-independent phosphoglycerate mutase [Dehalococcoidia bacterium]
MKYCVLIIDGASGWPLPRREGKTCLELARTVNLDALAKEGTLGLVRTVPEGMEPSSGCACMSILGYDPTTYYRGRSAIEARSMGIPVADGEVVFRCNLVSVCDGRMKSYSSDFISTEEATSLVAALNDGLGGDKVRFYPGVSYRQICKIKDREDTLLATCTPPHDIHGRPVDEFLPRGPGSDVLRDLMRRSEDVLRDHPVNAARRARGDVPVTMVWLFWSSGRIPDMPAFEQVYGLRGAMTSGVDLLRGLATMVGMEVLDIPGVTGDQDNDYAAQVAGAQLALEKRDIVVIHVEAPDEASHAGSIEDKIVAIEMVDKDIVSQVRHWGKNAFRVLVMPDHATPIQVQTHIGEPVPFMLWGAGFAGNGAERFTEAEAKGTGVFLEQGHGIMKRLLG